VLSIALQKQTPNRHQTASRRLLNRIHAASDGLFSINAGPLSPANFLHQADSLFANAGRGEWDDLHTGSTPGAAACPAKSKRIAHDPMLTRTSRGMFRGAFMATRPRDLHEERNAPASCSIPNVGSKVTDGWATSPDRRSSRSNVPI